MFSVPWVGHICYALEKIGNRCPELLQLSSIWSMGQRLVPLVISSFFTKLKVTWPSPQRSMGTSFSTSSVRLWQLGFHSLLLCPLPRQPLPSTFWPLLFLQLLNSLLCACLAETSDLTLMYCSVLILRVFVSSHQTVSSWKAGTGSYSLLKSGTHPRGSIQMYGVEQSRTIISVPG